MVHVSKLLVLWASLVLAGCRYDVALPPDTDLRVDHSAVGQWRVLDRKGDHRLQVVEFTDREYLLEYRVDGESIAMRGYPVGPDDERYVQVQVLSTSKRVLAVDERKFDLLKYRLDGDSATLWRLDADVVETGIERAAALRKAIDAPDGAAFFEVWMELERIDEPG